MNDAQKKNCPPSAKAPTEHGGKEERNSWKKLKGRQEHQKHSFQEERNTNMRKRRPNQTQRMRNVEPTVQGEKKKKTLDSVSKPKNRRQP